MNIVTDSGHSRPLKNKIVELTSSQRLKRSFKAAGIYLGLALGSVFIPVFHFILVPLFLTLALWAVVSHYKDTRFIDLTDSSCPSCQQALKESAVYFKDQPSRLYCYQCRTQLWIRMDSLH